ncbi:MAG: hypothetical protein P8101_13305 [Candidatus Thiodiazotropha sp.]
MPKYVFSARSDDEKEREESSSYYGFFVEYEIEASSPDEACRKGIKIFNFEHPGKDLNKYTTDVAWSG